MTHNPFILPSEITKEEFLSYVARIRTSCIVESWTLILFDPVLANRVAIRFLPTFDKYCAEIMKEKENLSE